MSPTFIPYLHYQITQSKNFLTEIRLQKLKNDKIRMKLLHLFRDIFVSSVKEFKNNGIRVEE